MKVTFFLKKVTGKREIQKAFKYSIFSSDGSETVLVTFMLKGIIEIIDLRKSC